jgi:hypothetical protein
MVFKHFFNFGIGVVVGLYIGQNYNIPDIKKWSFETFELAKKIEKKIRKDENENR